jgi:AcrR family transcriptional regulator
MARSDPLDERLVQQALRLVEREGPEGVSLREIARRTGVSHGAPLRHFDGLADLLSEVAARGFRMLSEAVEKSGASLAPGAGALERLAAAARAYVKTAVEHPGLFALMFRPGELDFENEALERESRGSFLRLVEIVRAAQDAGWQPERDTLLLAGAVWSSLHGLAALWSQAAFRGPIPGASLDDALDTLMELVLGDAGDGRGDER